MIDLQTEWYIKVVNATTRAQCPICNTKVETVTNEDDMPVVICEHKPDCKHYHLTESDPHKYTHYPPTETDLKALHKLLEGKSV